jgi:hypothetical protein
MIAMFRKFTKFPDTHRLKSSLLGVITFAVSSCCFYTSLVHYNPNEVKK